MKEFRRFSRTETNIILREIDRKLDAIAAAVGVKPMEEPKVPTKDKPATGRLKRRRAAQDAQE